MKIKTDNLFFTAGGKLDITSTEPLNIAFIGGSLTEGEIDYGGTSLEDNDLKWSNVVLRFLSGLFPLRPISALNAGLGGTGSEYAAVRFQRDVLSHKPDIVFIEFSCNDRPMSDEDCNENGKIQQQIYLESMIRQCMQADKVPVIIYMHVPLPIMDDEAHFYKKGCDFKQEILDYYGIGTVDAMADVMQEFEAAKALLPNLTLTEFFKKYYEYYENGGFNVHPYASGYLLFAMSLINALSRAPEKYLKPFKMNKEPYCKEHTAAINERYNYVPAASERITFEGDWTLYTKESPFVCDDPIILIKEKKLKQAVQFTDGVMQTYKPQGASFSFDTEADRICMPHVSAKAGLGATVYADGIKVGETSCHSIWHGMNYTGPWINLPKGKKRVQFAVENATDTEVVFRFGYIVEAFEAGIKEK